MANSEISQIEDLLDGTGSPIDGNSPIAAVGAIQDLLIGHGYRVPKVGSSEHGNWNDKRGRTKRRLLQFCKQHCPAAVQGNAVPKVDKNTLQTLLSVPASKAIASRVYVTRVLNLPFTQMTKVACLISIGEGNGEFGAMCLNKDKAGLSLGMIQWAQVPMRLNELLKAVPRARLDQAMGSAAIAQKVLDHTNVKNVAAKIYGGVLKSTGKPTDPAMDLTKGDWPDKFALLCTFPDVQVAQINAAVTSFNTFKAIFDTVFPGGKSERLVAYLLDVANQFDKAARTMFKQAVDQGGLPAAVKEQGIELIKRVTKIATDRLRTIGETVKDGKQKWTEEFIVAAQKSRNARAEFFLTFDELADTPIN